MKFLLLLLLIVPIRVNAFSTSATSAILLDQDTNRILYAENIHAVRSVASISKIMTAVVAIESGKLDEMVTIGQEIDISYGSNVYLKKGEQIKLLDLVYALMLRSGNDASLSIAKKVGGSVEGFVTLMNEKAKELGMKNTTFNNPNGLDEEKANYSTAYDMAILASYAMKNETYKLIVSTKKHIVKTNMNYYRWTNKNRLLFSYKYITGGKTGFTEIAKRTLVTTASKDGLNLVVVTLNDGNDFLDHKNLYEEAFNTYKKYKIIAKGDINIINTVYESLYLKEDFYYPLTKEEAENIVLKIKLEETKKDKAGTLNICLDDKSLYETNLYYRKQKTWFQKLIGWLNDK